MSAPLSDTLATISWERPVLMTSAAGETQGCSVRVVHLSAYITRLKYASRQCFRAAEDMLLDAC